jgi:hypothetical protein
MDTKFIVTIKPLLEQLIQITNQVFYNAIEEIKCIIPSKVNFEKILKYVSLNHENAIWYAKVINAIIVIHDKKPIPLEDCMYIQSIRRYTVIPIMIESILALKQILESLVANNKYVLEFIHFKNELEISRNNLLIEINKYKPHFIQLNHNIPQFILHPESDMIKRSEKAWVAAFDILNYMSVIMNYASFLCEAEPAERVNKICKILLTKSTIYFEEFKKGLIPIN